MCTTTTTTNNNNNHNIANITNHVCDCFYVSSPDRTSQSSPVVPGCWADRLLLVVTIVIVVIVAMIVIVVIIVSWQKVCLCARAYMTICCARTCSLTHPTTVCETVCLRTPCLPVCGSDPFARRAQVLGRLPRAHPPAPNPHPGKRSSEGRLPTSKKRTTRQWHRGKGVLEPSGCVLCCKNKGSNMQRGS